MNKIIGFSRGDEKKEEKALDNLENTLLILKSSSQSFEKIIIRELTEIRHLENNLELISSEIVKIEQHTKVKEKLVKDLFTESEKDTKDLNLDKCESFISSIQQLNQWLLPLIDKVWTELNKLKVNETHEIYKESKDNQKTMKQIDKKSRGLLSNLRIMHNSTNSLEQSILKAQQKIVKIKEERRLNSNNSNTRKIGF